MNLNEAAKQMQETMNTAIQIGHGKLGWGGHADIMVALGVDRSYFRIRGNKRIRRKKMKQLIQRVFFQKILDDREVLRAAYLAEMVGKEQQDETNNSN